MSAPVPSRRSAGNLPAELTTFVGRRQERSDIKRLLSDTRLLTLTGFGGIGKTRLALHAAADLQRAFRDGAWLAELAPLSDPALVADTVAKSLGLSLRGEGSATQALADSLADRDILLILDNCEHLLDACALLVNTLLRACPGLRILATSRAPLRCRGETVLPIAPLTLPAEGSGPGDLATGYNAVRLFTDRARSADPGFALTDDNRDVVVAICRRLDGIPLALELAAVRLRGLSPAELLERLSNHFQLLSAGGRDAPERQRTLRGCIEWSYDLCTAAERRLWAQASVFPGSFEIDAVETVCQDGEAATDQTLETLLSLVDKSIVRREEHCGRTRYRMLEVIRRFGEDRLRESADGAATRRRHRDFFTALVAQGEREWFGTRQRPWMGRMALEQPNLRAAFEFCLEDPAEAEAGLEIAGRLREMWIALGALNEGAHWLERLLNAGPVSVRAQLRALWTAAWMALVKGDLSAAKPLIAMGTRLARDLDQPMKALMKQVTGMYAMFSGDLPRAITCSEQALAWFRSAGDQAQEISTLILAEMAYGYAGQADEALARYGTCLELATQAGDTWYRSYATWAAGMIHWQSGATGEALSLLRESLRLKRQMTDEVGLTVCLETLACVTADSDTRLAAELLGVASARWTKMGGSITRIPRLGPAHADTEAQLRAALGEAEFGAAFERGRALDPEEGLDLAAATSTAATTSRPARTTATPLTRREQEVAALVTRGLTNKQIAGKLVISQRTAETHVEHILTKLGFTSRTQIASWMLDQHV
ncbi:MAG TPA: LuxR C-terminal-related transcriptional regulator [Amycolatopsis sp.]|nr:LuxR C-terminal-related transcriptional regulator [Amycolatopsis sp.]